MASCSSFDHELRNCPKKAEYYASKNERPAILTASNNFQKVWILDSGASQHLTPIYDDLHEVRIVNEGEMSFIVGNNQLMIPTHVGKVNMGRAILTDVYYCKECPAKLVSESRLLAKGCKIVKEASTGECQVILNNVVVMQAEMKNSLFCLTNLPESVYPILAPVQSILAIPGVEEVKNVTPVQQPYDPVILLDYHRRNGHVNMSKCIQLLNMKNGKKIQCSDCCLTKLRRGWAPSETCSRASLPIYRLHVDLSGRKRVSLHGYRYYMMVVDDYSRKKWSLNLKLKSQAFQVLKEHITLLEKSKPTLKVAVIRTDGGGEFISNEMTLYMKEQGIQREISAPNCQYQNGVAERAIGVIDSSAKAMMLTASSPTYDWNFATNYAAFLLNYVTVDKEKDCPNTLFDGVQRQVKFQGIFGCLVYAKIYVRTKAENQARRCIFLGCSEVYKAAIVRDVTAHSRTTREYYARDVRFDESQFPYMHSLIPRPSVPPLDKEDILELTEVERQKLSSDFQEESKAVAKKKRNLNLDPLKKNSTRSTIQMMN